MQEITKAKDQRPKTRDRIVWVLFALVIVAVYFSGLSIPLLGPDEPRYAQVAREMFERNDWITPTLGGTNWFEKPALLYWLQIASYNIFGVSESAARFGSALFGLGTIFSLWILGRSVQSSKLKAQSSIEESKTSNDLANWLALIAASSIGFLAFSRGASFDIILTFPLAASLVSFFIFDQSKEKSFTVYHLPLVAFYFFIGLALLAKGLIGIVFPFAIVAFYSLLSRRWPDKFFIFSLFWGTILSLIIASSWYLPMYLTHGWTFVDEFFIQHHFERYTSNKYQHPQPFYFFFWVLPLMTTPWLPFFFASIWNFIRVQSSKFKVQSLEKLPTSNHQLSIFAFAWLFVPLIFFSFSGSKLPGYILPALPAALILTAEYISCFVEKSRRRKYAVQFITFVAFAVVAVALQFFVPSYAQADTTKYLIETANANGYGEAKILNLHTISHNAEFYAAGRLVRNDDGKLKKFLGVALVDEEIWRAGGRDVLVLVPLEYLHEFPESDLVESKILADNGELAIVAVKNR
ncbi:MAG: glycosyltransferase family 39 protein [Acidobacteriota bacterium]|nr:glycosyltransferase family 39 protein [Acidobacteriota bacterium]